MISKAVALKGAGALGAATAASGGVYYAVDHFQNQLTIFDRGLIEFLGEDVDIEFKVAKKDTTGETDITTNSALDFASGSGDSIVIKVSLGSSGSVGALTEKEGTKATKSELKKLNGGGSGTDWTWSCEIKLNRKTENNTITELKDKELLFKDASGFLNKLKASENKDLKRKFIENCAKERGKDKNREINKLANLKTTKENLINAANEINVEKSFQLRIGVTTKNDRQGNKEVADKLYFESETEFSSWFIA